MNRLNLFLSGALVLSLAAVLSVVSRPTPIIPKTPASGSAQAGLLKLDGRLSHAAVYSAGSELYAEYTVRLDEAPVTEAEQPISLALVLDRSGSMSGQKMDDARRAAHRLVDLLDARDELTFITFSDRIESTALLTMNAENKATVHAAIEGVTAAGATYLSGGIEAGTQALKSARGARRMVVVSDGQPTAGVVEPSGLVQLVGRAHDLAITVTALGVGAEYDGMLMQHLAERGGGMYGYLRDGSALDEVLSKEVTAARTSRVRNVELVLRPSNGLRILEVPGRHVEYSADGDVLHLADLRPGAPTRVLVRLASDRVEADQTLDVSATLRYRPLNGETLATWLPLKVLAIDDGDAALKSREEGLWAAGVSATGSVRMLAAAAAYERGDLAKAGSLLDNAKSLFGMSADALAGTAEVEKMRTDFGGASVSKRKELSRSLESKKLINFGRENEGY